MDKMNYAQMTKEQLMDEEKRLKEKYEEYKARGLSLDMSRGKPDTNQLDLSIAMLDILTGKEACLSANGTDYRNYGFTDGTPEAKALFSELLEVPAENIIVMGNSSLSIMYDTMARCMLYGVPGGNGPWCKEEKVKFLCPSPGYDRHFAVCESLGIEMIYVPMTPDGPDMDIVESLVKDDAQIKGIWCVPKYSNPEGITYSDETVRRFARLQCAAPDFRIFWDNAYVVHDLYDDGDVLLNLFEEAARAGQPDIVYLFASTSKISFPGSGVAVMAASERNIKHIKSVLQVQTIGYDKLNMQRHVHFFKNAAGVKEHMKKHAAILRPKFELVLHAFERELAPCGIAEWTKPKGGYFISLNLADGCAARVYALALEAGVTLTAAGAAFPYGKDPRDRNLRIAPTYPTIEELGLAVEVLCVCCRLAAVEKQLHEKS